MDRMHLGWPLEYFNQNLTEANSNTIKSIVETYAKDKWITQLFNQKSSAKCEEKMNDGRRLFTISPSSTTKLLKLYTEAVLYAPNDSVELSRAYGNRSAILCNAQLYEDSLMDIDRALALKYPDNLKFKLYARKAKNLLALGPKNRSAAEQALAEARNWMTHLSSANKNLQKNKLKKLSKQKVFEKPFEKPDNSSIVPDIVDPHEQLIGASKAIELKYSEKYGRHFVATRDIEPGEILVRTQAYIFTLPENLLHIICWNCSKRTWASVPCKNCIHVAFCDENCRDEAWNNFHDIECPTLIIMPSTCSNDGLILGTKITIKALKEAGSVASLKKMVEKIHLTSDPLTKGFIKGKLDESKYASIYDLTDCRLQSIEILYPDRFERVVLIVTILAIRTEIFGKKIDNANDFLNNDLIMFTVKLLYENVNVGLMNLFKIQQSKRLSANKVFELEKIMVSCLISLFNHSCDSNGYLVHSKNILGVRSIQKINKGQQIFISYGEDYELLSKIDRQNKLRDIFGFLCDCHACKGNWGPISTWPSFMTQSLSSRNIVNVTHALVEIENQLGTSDEYTKQKILSSDLRYVSLISKVLNILQENLDYSCKEVIRYKRLLKCNLFHNSG